MLLEAMDGSQFVFGMQSFLFQVIVRLQSEPESGTCSKIFGKAKCGVSGYPAFFPEDLADPGLRNEGFFRQAVG